MSVAPLMCCYILWYFLGRKECLEGLTTQIKLLKKSFSTFEWLALLIIDQYQGLQRYLLGE